MPFRIHFFEELDSTNDTAREPCYDHGDVIVAERQRCGRGQRGNAWSSAAGQNLTLSVVLRPDFLPAASQFSLLQCVALSVTDMLASSGLDARIKWTNDIYIGDGKLAGILMEQSLRGGYMDRCVAGIGMNVNQTEFEPWIPNPVSLALETGRRYDRTQLLESLCRSMEERFGQLRKGSLGEISDDYHALLYRRGQESLFELPSGQRLRARVLGVRPGGELMLETAGGQVREFLFGQIKFVI